MMKKIFSSGRTGERQDVIAAASGHDYTDNESGNKYVVLKNGVRYVGEPGSGDYRVLRFETYALLVVPVSTERTQKRKEATATLNLLNSNDRGLQAELHWRLAKPISVFILTAFAMVLAYTDTRRGRVANLFVAILIYFIYTNLLAIGDTLLKSGRLPVEVGLWWVHGGFALLAGYFLFRRDRHRPLIAWNWSYRRR
jgi:lipopolysaccharide export system permease protein